MLKKLSDELDVAQSAVPSLQVSEQRDANQQFITLPEDAVISDTASQNTQDFPGNLKDKARAVRMAKHPYAKLGSCVTYKQKMGSVAKQDPHQVKHRARTLSIL
jgi:hypothetical protein